MSSWQIRKIKHVFDSAKQDADVQTTVVSAQTKHTILVGDDTDLLVLLLHPDINAKTIFSCLLRIHRHLKLKRYGAYNSARLGEHLLFMHAIVGYVKLQVVSLDWAKELQSKSCLIVTSINVQRLLPKRM